MIRVAPQPWQRSWQKVSPVYHWPARRYLQGVSGLWSVVSGPWAGLQGAAATEETHFLVRKILLVRTSLLFSLHTEPSRCNSTRSPNPPIQQYRHNQLGNFDVIWDLECPKPAKHSRFYIWKSILYPVGCSSAVTLGENKLSVSISRNEWFITVFIKQPLVFPGLLIISCIWFLYHNYIELFRQMLSVQCFSSWHHFLLQSGHLPGEKCDMVTCDMVKQF